MARFGGVPMTTEDGADLRTSALDRAHGVSVRLPHELVQELNQNLGTTLVAYIADVRSRQMPAQWAQPFGAANHAEPRNSAKQRLYIAHQLLTAIAEGDGWDTARSWMIGDNPVLDGNSPAQRIREGGPTRAVYAA